jgi:hypothetical protein
MRTAAYNSHMSIETQRRGSRAPFGVLAVLLYTVFIVLTAMPQIVLCHRADGRLAVEFAGPASACMCEECEHCLERLAEHAPPQPAAGASLENCHCRHEPVLTKASRSAFRRDDGEPKIGSGAFSPLPASGLSGRGGLAGRPESAGVSPPSNPVLDTPHLRC